MSSREYRQVESGTQTPVLVDDAVADVDLAVGGGLRGREVVRLALVGGLIAAAAAADLAGGTLPQPKLVAVGAAVLGALVVLRRQPTSAETEQPEAEVKQPRGRSRRRTYEFERRLDIQRGRVEELEKRLTELGGRQTLLKLDAQDSRAELEQRLQALEAAIEQAHERSRQQTERLQDLIAHITDQIHAITQTAKG